MKKKKATVAKAIAKFTYKTAKEGAGLASWFSLHQPKVPKKFAK